MLILTKLSYTMENNFAVTEPVIHFMDLNLDIQEFSIHVGCEQYFIIRQELNKFMLYLNRSEYSISFQDQIHNLYISLFHLENMEKALHSSDLTEGIMHQSKIIDKLQLLKMAILDTIDEIETDCSR